MSGNTNSQLLQRVFGFNEEDLLANQYGQLSSRQVERYVKYTPAEIIQRNIRTSLLPLVVLSVLLCGTLMEFGRGNLAALIFAFIISGMMGFLSYKSIYKPLYRFEPPKVKRAMPQVGKICGMVMQVTESHSSSYIKSMIYQPYVRSIRYYVEVGFYHHEFKRFKVTSRQFFAFKNGEYYCVYYLIDKNKILSVKPLAEDEITNLNASIQQKSNVPN